MYLNLFFKSVKAAGNRDEGCDHVKALVRQFVQVLVSGGGGDWTGFVGIGGLMILFLCIPGLCAMIHDKRKEAAEATPYDPRKSDPQYAHASVLPLWELTPFLNHYHAAIALHARQLFASPPLAASAVLSQNTLSNFLDPFSYKNPKNPKSGENSPATAPAQWWREWSW
ncbi:hypothetical protein GALMADRAFT_1344538 [Galerina marginata CBS 339.88]|uniref:CCAAT-binding factor domain-containing protein n=1 Tax=Galerina marginata (strain CBS 339.88) TaxID=685588 RepID=A0A067SLJ3_GALM3|nr:hypothetical protein GALMADRAFT_1344538 [Galerina marginata CBS 339.88]